MPCAALPTENPNNYEKHKFRRRKYKEKGCIQYVRFALIQVDKTNMHFQIKALVHLDQLYAAFPSDNKPSFPVDTVAFSKCLMLMDDRAEVTIINTDTQSLRNS